MLHIVCSREPSQKLSKPVPNRGFAVIPRTKFQIAVRPVRVGSRPITDRTLGAMKTAKSDKHIAAITRVVNAAGLRKKPQKFVSIRSVAPSVKQEREVIEFAVQK